MIAEIHCLLGLNPFRPFAIITSSGKQYEIPSSEHAGFNPAKTRALVWFDDDSHIDLSALHITAIECKAPADSEVV